MKLHCKGLSLLLALLLCLCLCAAAEGDMEAQWAAIKQANRFENLCTYGDMMLTQREYYDPYNGENGWQAYYADGYLLFGYEGGWMDLFQNGSVLFEQEPSGSVNRYLFLGEPYQSEIEPQLFFGLIEERVEAEMLLSIKQENGTLYAHTQIIDPDAVEQTYNMYYVEGLPPVSTVYTDYEIDAETLLIRKQTFGFGMPDGSEMGLATTEYTYGADLSATPAAPLLDVATRAPGQGDWRTATVICNPDTPQEATYAVTVPAHCRVMIQHPDGAEVFYYTDRACTQLYETDPEGDYTKDSTLYAQFSD